jgi:transcriptional regulator with XRE-family HTH domain
MPKQKHTLPIQMAGAAKRLKEARKATGMSQKELEDKSGVNQGRISRIENGDRMEGISAAAFVRLARPLGVRAGWLLTGEEPRYPNTVLAVERGSVRAEVVDVVREELSRHLGGGQPTLLLTDGGEKKKRRVRRARGPVMRTESNGHKPR